MVNIGHVAQKDWTKKTVKTPRHAFVAGYPLVENHLQDAGRVFQFAYAGREKQYVLNVQLVFMCKTDTVDDHD
jgi:hypothetical protein